MFKRFHTWFTPALAALILFVGGVASNWVAADLQADLEPIDRGSGAPLDWRSW